MNAPVVKISARAPIDLAHVADFELGALRVRPAAREVEAADNVERMEPRVMQALVALHEAEGAVVSRDDLIARCWGGVAVGDDAINRVMLKLRRVATTERGLTIQTIARVGYRLRRIEAAPALTEPEQAAAAAPQPAWAFVRRRWRAFAGAGAAAALTVAAGVALAARTPEYALSGFDMVAQSPRSEIEPALTPDGRTVVYVARSGAPPNVTSDLFMRSIAGSDEQQLTDTRDFLEQAPALSPSGDRLAYQRFKVGGYEPEHCQIVLRAFPSGADRVVGVCQSPSSRISWTTDGRSLVFSDTLSGNGPRRVRALDIASGETRDLVPAPSEGMGDFNAAVSPDGSRVALVRHGTLGSADVFVYDLRNGAFTRITEGESWAHTAWGDRHSLLVTLARGDATELWRYGADGRGRATRLLPPLRRLSRPAVASGVIALQTETTVETLHRLTRTGATPVTSGNHVDASADFSDNGVLAFIASRSEHWLYLRRPGDTPQRLVQLRGNEPRGLRWAPDGRRLVYAAVHGGHARIFIGDARTGAIREVPMDAGFDPGNPAWSADGRTILFTANDSAGPRLMRVSAEGGAPRAISSSGWVEAIETEDGVFARRAIEPGVWRLAPGRAPELAFSLPNTWCDNARGRTSLREWTIVRGRIYAIDARGADGMRVVSRAVTGGAVAHVAAIDAPFASSLAVNPQTGEIIYAAVVDAQADIGVAAIERR